MKSSRPKAYIAVIAAAAVTASAFGVLSSGSASAAASVSAPVPVGPKGTVPVLKDVRVAWSPVRGADGYRVEVGTDTAWSDDPTWTADTLGTQLALPTWLPHASYVWRVSALQGKAAGPWSANATFSKGWRDRPALSSPTAGQVLSSDLPTFTWMGVKDASAYELQVSNCPTFNDKTPSSASSCPDPSASSGPAANPTPSSVDNNPTQDQARPFVDTCFTTHTTVTPFTEDAEHHEDNAGPCVFTQLDNSTPLYWRVRGADRYVGTAADVDTTPASTSGISHLPPSRFPKITDVTSACPTPDATASASATATATATATASPTATPSESKPGGCDPTHPVEFSAWSETRSFELALSARAEGDYNALPRVASNNLDNAVCKPDADSTVVDGSASPNNNLVCSDFPTITWQPVFGASSYRVTISLDDGYSNIQRIVDTPALAWTPTDSWRQNDVDSYYYVVQPCTTAGCGAVRSDPLSFRKQTPAVSAVSPVTGGAILSTTTPVSFLWSDLADAVALRTGSPSTTEAYGYHLVVADKATNPNFDKQGLALDVTTDGVLCTQATSGTAVTSKTDPAVQTCDGAQVFSASSVGSVVGYTPDTVSLADGTYLWKVQAIDPSAHRLPYSQPQTFRIDRTPPSAVSATPGSKIGVNQAVRVTFSEPVSGISTSTVKLSPSTPSVVQVLDSTHALIRPTAPFAPGSMFRVLLASGINDTAGNVAVNAGPAFTVATNVDDNSPASTYAGAWRRAASSNAVGGSYVSSNPVPRATTSVTMAFRGVGVVVAGCRAPAGGYADVYVDGVRKARVSTYRSYSGCGVRLASIQGLARGLHTVKVVGIGMHQTAAKGNAVGLDGFTVTP